MTPATADLRPDPRPVASLEGLITLARTVTPVYRIEPMRDEDIAEVSRVERKCFTNPWPASAYRRELGDREHNVYVVLREYHGEPDPDAPPAPAEPPRLPLGLGSLRQLVRHFDGNGRIVGFAGMWHLFEEAHITTIGVEPGHRGRGLGELLMGALVDRAVARRVSWLTLEVRVSNESAQSLYRKYGFTVQGTRKRYYSDNNEDAHIMWSPALNEPETLKLFAERRAAILARHPEHAAAFSWTEPVTPAAAEDAPEP